MDTKELTKLYYSIGEVADLFDVSTSLIRYWESEFPSLKPGKNSRGERKFTTKDIEHIELIYNLVKERGFTLEGAKKEISMLRKHHRKDHPESEHKDILEKLIHVRLGLISLRAQLDDLKN